jgi:PilZ domain
MEPTMTADHNRRFHARHAVTRRCKVIQRDTMSYSQATTRNVSEGGALLEVHSLRPLSSGDEIEVGIEEDDRGFISQQDLIFARVVRATEFGEGHQLVAVEYASLADLVAA